MGKPIVYQIPESPVSRTVVLVAKTIGLDIELKHVDFDKEEQLKPEYLALNPHHTVPTLVDGDYTVWDSHAINIYLIEKYAKNDSLYPKDLQKRTLINQRLFFDTGVLFPLTRDFFFEVFLYGLDGPTERTVTDFRKGYELLNALFRGNKFLVGDTLTLADISAIPVVTELNTIVPIDDTAFPNIRPWIKRLHEAIPCLDEVNTKGVESCKIFLENKLKENANKKK